MAHGMPRLDMLRELDDAGELRERLLGARPGRAAARRRRGARAARAAAPAARASTHELARIPVAAPVEPPASARPRPPSRSAWRPTSRPRSCSPPARLDPRPDARRLGLRRSPTTAPRRSASPRSRRLVAGDPRFVVSRSPRRLGFYRNFERALALAPRRRALRRARRPGRRLAPGQARDAARRRSATRSSSTATRASIRAGRRAGRRDLLGAARQQPRRPAVAARARTRSPARRRCSRATLLDAALPFPPGAVRALPRPLARALRARARRDRATSTGRSTTTSSTAAPTLGHAAANRMPTLRDRLGALRRDPRERIRLWRMHYFVDVCRLLAVRDGPAAALRRRG